MTLPVKDNISWSDFEKIDIRVGTVISARSLDGAIKPAFVVEIDFGPLGIKKSSAQLTKLYTTDQLINQQVLAVVNFPPKQIATILSECLVLGLYSADNSVVLISPERPIENGCQLG